MSHWYDPPHDEEAQQHHDHERKACAPDADDGPARMARIERALLEEQTPRHRQNLEMELLRLRAVFGYVPTSFAAE